MKFLVLVPIYRRHDVLRLFNDSLETLISQGYEIDVLAVGDQKDESIAKELGYNYVIHRNILGEKLNAALKHAKKLDFDAMIMLGSDDILNAAVLDFYEECFDHDYNFVGFLNCYFYDLEKKNMIKWEGYRGERRGEPIGAWRCFTRQLIEELKWELWDNQHHSIDYTMWQKIKKREDLLLNRLFDDEFICDLKTSENITKFRKFDNSRPVNAYEALDLLDDKLKNKILNYGK